MNDVVVLLIIWILAMLIIIVSLARQPNNPVSNNLVINNGLNLPIVGIQGFTQPLWVNQLMLGKPIDFGCYILTVRPDHLLINGDTHHRCASHINDQIIKVKPRLTNVTAYLVEFDFRVILCRGSPFIKTSLPPSDPNKWYNKNGYIWLKLDLPSFYGQLEPSIINPSINVTDNLISIGWKTNVYYWVPDHLSNGWQGEVLYVHQNKILGYGKEWHYYYFGEDYRIVNNLFTNIFDQRLVYNINVGQIEPIPLVIEIVKNSLYQHGIPVNPSQRARLKLLIDSILNYRHNQYFTFLPIIDIYLMEIADEQLNLSEALSILRSLVKWSSLVN